MSHSQARSRSIFWDLAGAVIKQAANGTGPKVGSRVMGMVNARILIAWQITSRDARRKLELLYPVKESHQIDDASAA